MKSGNLPAAPCTAYAPEGLPEVTELGGRTASFPGLTKREYFAGLAMQSILAADTEQSYTSESIAREATQVADALLSALEQEQAK